MIGCVVVFLLVVARMTMLVRQVQAQAVVLEEQADRLHEVARQDPLTGLPAGDRLLKEAGRDRIEADEVVVLP